MPEKLAQTNYVPKVPDSGTNLAHNVAIQKMVNILKKLKNLPLNRPDRPAAAAGSGGELQNVPQNEVQTNYVPHLRYS